MKHGLICAALLLPLAGCGNSDDGKATGERAAVSIQPGEWEITNKVVSTEVVGAPAGFSKEQLGKEIAPEKASVEKICLTADDVSSPDGDLFGIREKDGCKAADVTLRDGKLNAHFACMPEGLTLTAKINGSYSSDSFQAEAATDFKGPGGLAVELRSTIDGKRLGDCKSSK